VTIVADLVAHLDAAVPFAWAADWDRVGLLAGDPSWALKRVFVAVDPTHETLDRAVAAEASVLLTHHPAFLDPLEAVVDGPDAAGLVFDAVRRGVALVNCHTNQDRAPGGADALPTLLGLEMLGPLEPVGNDLLRPRMGRVCEAPAGATLESLALLVGEALGVRVRAWGPAQAQVRLAGVAPGSGRSLVPAAVAAGCDALVTGELRYHEARAALEAGLLVIEAGHDATEWPLTRDLARIAATTPGLDASRIVIDDPAYPWWIA
jgi:dinuclear metal center YbgI/SA1388 family protein